MRKQQNPVRVYLSQSNPDEWHVGTTEYTRFFYDNCREVYIYDKETKKSIAPYHYYGASYDCARIFTNTGIDAICIISGTVFDYWS